MEQLLDVAQTARLLNLSESYVYQLARQRKIPCVKISSAIRFRPSDIEAWVEEMSVMPGAEVVAMTSRKRGQGGRYESV